MAKWTMKKDRELIRLAGTKLSVDQIAARLGTSPESVIKTARRLGINVGRPSVKRDGRLKAKKL
jgi:hypothetical protein